MDHVVANTRWSYSGRTSEPAQRGLDVNYGQTGSSSRVGGRGELLARRDARGPQVGAEQGAALPGRHPADGGDDQDGRDEPLQHEAPR